MSNTSTNTCIYESARDIYLGCTGNNCCQDLVIAKNAFYRLVQLTHIISSIIGLVLTAVYCIKYTTKHVLPRNTQVFNHITLVSMTVHSIALGSFHMLHIYASFTVSETTPCQIRNSVQFCGYFRYPYSFCLCLLVFNQYFLFIDRMLETYMKNYKLIAKQSLLIFIIGELTVTSWLVYFVFKEEVGDQTLLSCLNMPIQSLLKVSSIPLILLPLNIACLIFSFSLFKTYKKEELKSRFHLLRRYNASMSCDAYAYLRRVAITQSIFIVLYPICVTTGRASYFVLQQPEHKAVASLAYVMTYYCAVVPGVMIFSVRKTAWQRRARIESAVSLTAVGEKGSENYFKSLTSQWDSALDNTKKK